MDNDYPDKKVMGHLSSPLKNQMDILQTLLVCNQCPTQMYTPGNVHQPVPIPSQAKCEHNLGHSVNYGPIVLVVLVVVVAGCCSRYLG